MPRKLQMTIHLEPSTLQDIKKLSDEYGVSQNFVIGQLLTAALDIWKHSEPIEGRTLKHTIKETWQNG